jgi:hypothetical protein
VGQAKLILFINYGRQSNSKILITTKSYHRLKYYLTPPLFTVGFDSCKKRNFVRRFLGRFQARNSKLVTQAAHEKYTHQTHANNPYATLFYRLD